MIMIIIIVIAIIIVIIIAGRRQASAEARGAAEDPRRQPSRASGVHKGGFSKGEFSNWCYYCSIIAKPPFTNPRAPLDNFVTLLNSAVSGDFRKPT